MTIIVTFVFGIAPWQDRKMILLGQVGQKPQDGGGEQPVAVKQEKYHEEKVL
jgi:hypothetical protein